MKSDKLRAVAHAATKLSIEVESLRGELSAEASRSLEDDQRMSLLACCDTAARKAAAHLDALAMSALISLARPKQVIE